MNGYRNLDRYDFLVCLLMGGLLVAALVLNAPLWALTLVFLAGNTTVFIRHFDQIMRS